VTQQGAGAAENSTGGKRHGNSAWQKDFELRLKWCNVLVIVIIF